MGFNLTRKKTNIIMKKVLINTGFTDEGYCCCCDLLPGWMVAYTGEFKEFQKEVEDSIRFFVDCAKADGEDYPSVLDEDYEIVYKFDVCSLLNFYRGIFSFSALQTITGINQKQLAHYASGLSHPRPQQARKIASGLHRLATEMLLVTV